MALTTVADIENLINDPMTQKGLDSLEKLAQKWQEELVDGVEKNRLIETLDAFIEAYQDYHEEALYDAYFEITSAARRYTQRLSNTNQTNLIKS